MIPLHSEVKSLAGDRPALVLSMDAIRSLLIDNFARTVRHWKSTSVSVPVEGYSDVEVCFINISVDPDDFQMSLSGGGSAIIASFNRDFVFEMALHLAGDRSKEFSRISIRVANFQIRIKSAAPFLLLSQPEFDVDRGVIQLSSTRSEALKDPRVEEADVLRIEGSLAYVLPRRILSAALSTIEKINLSETFPALGIQGEWALEVVSEGVVVLPTDGIAVRPESKCPRRGSLPDLSLPYGGRKKLPGGGYSWSSRPTGVPPVAVNRRLEDAIAGFASLYAPKPLWEKRFEKAMPAVAYQDSGDSFIGYSLNGTAALKYTSLQIDSARRGLLIEYQLIASGSGFLNVDVPCIGRQDLGYARFESAPSTLRLFVSFEFAPTGKLLLTSRIEHLSIGDMRATVSLFGRYLAAAGGQAAVLGFLLDTMLARVVEQKLPEKLHEVIVSALNDRSLPLLDLEALESVAAVFTHGTYSGESDSMLIGVVRSG